MKYLLRILFVIFVYSNITVARADTITMTWLNEDGTTYDTTTCNAGDDVILPTAPTKRGYTFMGWIAYTPVEYLQSTGTQWIDTGFAFNAEKQLLPFAMDFTVSFLNAMSGNSVQKGFCGAQQYVMNAALYSWNNSGNSIGFYVAGSNTQVKSYKIPNVYGPTHLRLELNQLTGTYSALFDNEPLSTGNINSGTLNTSNANLYLFKSNGETAGASVRIHKFSYESNGVKIRDFIPVLDQYGTPCMFDKVTQQFFYNAGTGDFIAGPILSE